MFSKFKGLFSTDIGIDLGTANCLVYVKDRGVVLREPSVVAIEEKTTRVLAVGKEAQRMLGRTPGNILAIRPMKSGVIADFDVTKAMLSYFIHHPEVCPMRFWSNYSFAKPRVVIAVPGGITEVEKYAAAGSMIVDIGGGTCEVAIISLSGIVHSRSARSAGDAMDACIVGHMRRVYNLLIGDRTAEEIKMQIGSAFPTGQETTMEVRGRDIVAGLPKTMTISSEEIRDSLTEPVSNIVETVKTTLGNCEPELAADLVDRGIVLSGGSSLLRGLDKLIAQETGLPVTLADDPLSAVAEGTGQVMSQLDVLLKNTRR